MKFVIIVEMGIVGIERLLEWEKEVLCWILMLVPYMDDVKDNLKFNKAKPKDKIILMSIDRFH